MRVTFNILFVLATLVGMAVAAGGFMRRGITYGGVTSANYYWERMLRLWGTPVADHGTMIDYVWIGRDDYVFFSVAQSQLAAAYVPAARSRIEELIKSVPSSKYKQPGDGDYTTVDLQALTGQTFGNDSDRWQQWWDENRATFVPPAHGYERLKSMRIAAERAERGESYTERSLNRPWPPAWDYRDPWVRPLSRALAVLAGAVVLNIAVNQVVKRLLSRRHTAEPASENR
jgi:hypothetical protein